MKKISPFFLIVGLLMLSSSSAHAALERQTVEYQENGDVLEGYVVYDAAIAGKRPVVIVMHEWTGLGDDAKHRADMLAQMGYLAFAADLYGKGLRAETHEEAGKLSGFYLRDRARMRARAGAALSYIEKHELAESGKIAAIGYCFGGAAVLEMARAGFDLKGVASFHGLLKTPSPALPGEVKAKVIVFHGSQDPFVKAEDVLGFENEMSSAGADWQLVVFSNAVHRFTIPEAGSNPQSGAAYNREADLRSWKMLSLFLQEVFS